MRNSLVIFFFIFLNSILNGQYNSSFISHLANNNYQREYKAYLVAMEAQSTADSVDYFWGKYYLQYQQDSLFLIRWKGSVQLFSRDTNAYNLAAVSMLDKSGGTAKNWFEWPHELELSSCISSCQKIYRLGLNPHGVSTESLPMDDRMQSSLADYKKYYGRKAWKAGLLSVAIPGLGKIYAGKPRAGFLALSGCIMFGIQAWESYRKLSLGHPLTIVNLSFFTVFYGASIYGSAHAMKQTKVEKRNQFHKYAARYYRNYYRCKLYE